MNDIILSSLLNLFALLGSTKALDKEKAQSLIVAYLHRYYGVTNCQSYLNLYSELRDYYDEFPDMDKEPIVDGICSNLKSKVDVSRQTYTFLNLLEFSKLASDKFDPEDNFFNKVAGNFRIPDNVFADIKNFVQNIEGENVRLMPLGSGTLKTLRMPSNGSLLFTYEGEDAVLMNDVRVFNGIFQVWNQSGVLKSGSGGVKSFSPLYYSDIMALYNETGQAEKVKLCGRNVEFRFGDGSDNGMHNFTFDLESGQLVAIMGGSGVGKTTLLSLLNGSLKPDSGSITVNGHSIYEPEAKAMIGFVPQDDLLIEELTVYQNLWYTAKFCFEGMPEDQLVKKVMEMLRQLGLDAAKDLKVGSPLQKYISGGQRKRLNIALELIREPAILFLDEPTSGLSSSDTEKVVGLLKEQTRKGKLVVVNIHQPSSDVYKLFDRLWLLDRGGYPVFDGNPIEAVSYFKTAAEYADAQTSTCPTCGNVNPEVVLNIINETRLDSLGNPTDERKFTPQKWHEMYLDNRGDRPDVVDEQIPHTDQKRPGRLKQVLLFLKRNISSKVTNMQYLLVTLLEAPVLALVCACLTHYVPESGVYSIMDNKNLPSYIFMAIIVAIFLGMSGSAEEIIRDRALLKREKFLRLSYGSYIWSKVIYMAAVCLVQTFLFLIVGNTVMGVACLFWKWWLILFISAFLSSIIGLLLSQCMNSVVSIYITIPVLLIPQILLCGLVVHFEDLNPRSETGNVPIVGDFIPSRWAFEALSTATFSMNDYEGGLFELDRQKYSCQYYGDEFIYELKSQLETMQDEISKGLEPDPMHMEIVRTGLVTLAEDCGLEEYSGNGSYASIYGYLQDAEDLLKSEGNRVTLELDGILTDFIRQYSTEDLMALKTANCNTQLENFVLGVMNRKSYVIVGSHIVPRTGYIYLRPHSRIGRAPFYSGVKVLGDTEIPTYWYNVCVLLLMCLVLGIFLFLDVPGRYVRKEKN